MAYQTFRALPNMQAGYGNRRMSYRSCKHPTMGGRRRSTGMKKRRMVRPSVRGTSGLTKRHITARLMQSFAPYLLVQIRDRAGQRGGGIGSFFGKVRRTKEFFHVRQLRRCRFSYAFRARSRRTSSQNFPERSGRGASRQE